MTKKKLSNKRKKKIARECWDLDYAFYQWLLEHLEVYLKDASKIVDLEFNVQEYEGIRYSQREAIERMITICRTLLRNNSDYLFEYKLQNELLDLWKIWHRAMWW